MACNNVRLSDPPIYVYTFCVQMLIGAMVIEFRFFD